METISTHAATRFAALAMLCIARRGCRPSDPRKSNGKALRSPIMADGPRRESSARSGAAPLRYAPPGDTRHPPAAMAEGQASCAAPSRGERSVKHYLAMLVDDANQPVDSVILHNEQAIARADAIAWAETRMFAAEMFMFEIDGWEAREHVFRLTERINLVF